MGWKKKGEEDRKGRGRDGEVTGIPSHMSGLPWLGIILLSSCNRATIPRSLPPPGEWNYKLLSYYNVTVIIM